MTAETAPTDLNFDLLLLIGVPAGHAVQARAVEPGRTVGGQTFPGDHNWHDVPVVVDRNLCEHADTICVDCVEAWACDHDLRLAEVGAN